jgi:nucleoside 2-deoxyribosyltransferase
MAAKQKIFISGPMFSPADLWEGQKIKDALEADGFDTYWAPKDGIEDERLIQNLQNPLMALPAYQKIALLVQKIGWTLDIYMATYGCDGMVMDMNGRVPDGGSIVEAANAYAVGMPLVLYKETSITMWGPFNNPMIAALTKDWEPVDTVAKISPALTAAIAAKNSSYEYVPPPHFARDLEIGKFVAEHRDEVMKILLGISDAIEGAQKDVLADIEKAWHWLLHLLGLEHSDIDPGEIDLRYSAKKSLADGTADERPKLGLH